MSKSVIQRFQKFIELDLLSGCWLWKGAVINGYGYFCVNGKSVRAHRFSYTHWNGDIPQELQIHHLCRNTNCVNPEHLQVVTQKTNVLLGFNPCAINARKTHCVRGHKFNNENTRIYQERRHCKTCNRLRQRISEKK